MNGAALIALAAVGIALLGWIYLRDLRRTRQRRRSVFENCRGLLEDAVLTRQGMDYPVLSGQRDGAQVELRLLPDTIQLRKLPVLWLLVTVRRNVAVRGAFDMLLRPSNTEYYSSHDKLPEVIPTPGDWPEDAVIRTDQPDAITPLIARLHPHVKALTADGRCKEIFFSPRGLRLVYRIDESQRGHYLVTRQPLFENEVLDRATVGMLIARALELAETIEQAEQMP